MQIFSKCCFHKYKQFFPIMGDFYHIKKSYLISSLLFLSQNPIFTFVSLFCLNFSVETLWNYPVDFFCGGMSLLSQICD